MKTSRGVVEVLRQFFLFQGTFFPAVFRGNPDRGSGKAMDAAVRGEIKPYDPIVVRHCSGTQLVDVIWVDLFPLVSERVLEIVSGLPVTGWDTYKVNVYDARDMPVKGYHGLSITGRCDSIQVDKSNVVLRDYSAGRFPEYKGLLFSEQSWDGSDFFMAADMASHWIIVTQRVKKLLRKSKIRTCTFTGISEIQVAAPHTAVPATS